MQLTEMHPRILIVEDDLRARALLEEFLVRHGLSVTTLGSGERVTEVVSREGVSLVLLDLMLPGEDGLSICKRLRASGAKVPVIMLTARTETVDRIVGLEIGADDYVLKPFEPRELLARIGAVLRRHGGRAGPDDAPVHSGSVYSFGPFELDVDQRRLTRSGQVIVLTKGEFAVLEALSSHARQPLSRERLFKLARHRSFVIADRSMDIQISRLRRLIEADFSKPCYIQTVWGFGYVFVPEGDAQ
ncbi:MAG: two-component system, OmpR family, phosphate regulon response regulator OmpR [Gammaproteobacteria bacterium]|nr:two-component system, OmpR family, phosphate regulon response regulator OmpR [Gammaproteobacteria bacterium]